MSDRITISLTPAAARSLLKALRLANSYVDGEILAHETDDADWQAWSRILESVEECGISLE